MKLNRREFAASVLATAAGAVAAPAVWAQQKFEMKLAYFVGDQHAMSRWLIKWSEQLEKEFGRAHHRQALPRLADGAGAAALRFRPHRPGGRILVPARGDARAVSAHRAGAGAVPGGQRRDRHQGTQRPRAAGEISRRRASRPQGAAAADAPARQRAHHQEAGPHHRGHARPAHPLCLAHDPRFRGGARRHAGRRGTDRAGRAIAEGHDRRRVHRLRRRRHRLQDGRHPQILDRDVLLRVELRRRHERGFLGRSCRPTSRSW